MKPYQIYWKNTKYQNQFVGLFSTESVPTIRWSISNFRENIPNNGFLKPNLLTLLFIESVSDFIEYLVSRSISIYATDQCFTTATTTHIYSTISVLDRDTDSTSSEYEEEIEKPLRAKNVKWRNIGTFDNDVFFSYLFVINWVDLIQIH